MAGPRIYVCGRLSIEGDGRFVLERAFPARQGRRLWAYLVLRRRGPVARGDVIAAVWGEDPPDAVDAARNALVSRLRAALRPLPRIELHGEVGRYALALPQGTFIDTERARTALHEAEAALRTNDLGLALSEARVAMEIAARGFLDGEEGPWIEGQRRLLAETRLHALEVTVEAELARGNPGMAEREAELLLQLDPLRETGYRLMMRALAAGGNRAQAHAVMTRCARVLREQAGAAPSAETLALYQRTIA